MDERVLEVRPKTGQAGQNWRTRPKAPDARLTTPEVRERMCDYVTEPRARKTPQTGFSAALLALLIDPATHAPLRREAAGGKEVLVGPGTRYPIRQDIPIFVERSELTGLNRRYRRLYDGLAPFYDFPYTVYDLATRGGAKRARLGFLKELEIEAGDNVLEVSIGTGSNLPYLPAEAVYFGIDISRGMLRKCRRNLAKWKRQAQLFLSEAERLPFCDDAFDSVFHMGGMTFFNDRAAAIQEMVRVAKPGTKLLIVDEKERYHSGPFLPPVSLVPGGMEEVRYEDSRDGRLYKLSFRKAR